MLKIQPSDREGDPTPEEPGPSRPELTAIDGGLHLPGSVLVDEALGGGKTRLRRGLRATLLGGALLLLGAGLSAAVADAWFLTLGIAGAAATEGAFVSHEAGLEKLASGLRSIVFLAAVVLLAAGILVSVIALL